MMALLLTAAMRPVRRSGDEHADSAFALSVTRLPIAAVPGMTLSARPGTTPDAERGRARIHARASEMCGARSLASVALSLASSARVSDCDDRVGDGNDVPANRLNVPPVGVRLATAVAPMPLACTVSDALPDPSSEALNGTSAKSPPDAPPLTQIAVPV